MKILIAPDKFKGTLSAQEVCEALAKGLSQHGEHEIKMLPLADGGEGTKELFIKHLQAKPVSVLVHDPLMRPIHAEYALSADGKTAFIELASASGLSLLKPVERNPLLTTTFGTGELIRDALNRGVVNIFVGIGGSATNDAGLGLLSALGARMLNEKKEEFIPRGETLIDLDQIDFSTLHPQISKTTFTALCDVQNPFYGENGAACIYAPQKGANEMQVNQLDVGLGHVAKIIQQQTGVDLQKISGSGAGGGVAGGLHALLNTNLKRGIDVVFEITHFNEAIQWADVVITGEGKVDEQTWQGKVVAGVINEARLMGTVAIVVCGQQESNVQQTFEIYSLASEFGITRALKDTKAALSEIVQKIR